MASKKWLIPLGLAVSALCLWLAFRKVHWAELHASIHALETLPLLVGLLLVNLHNFVLAKRWHVITRCLAPVTYWNAFWSLRISFFFNMALPVRLGEPFRLFYLNRFAGLPLAEGVGAIAADRLFDLVTLISMAYPALLFLGHSGLIPASKIITASVILAFGLGLFLLRLPTVSSRRWINHLLTLQRKMKAGLRVMLHLHVLKWNLPLSWFAWTLHGWLVCLLAHAAGVSLSLPQALLVVTAVNVAIAIPASPGNIGTFELGAISMLTYLKCPPTEAALIAIVYHMIQMIPTLIIGALGYYFYFLNKKPPQSPNTKKPSRD